MKCVIYRVRQVFHLRMGAEEGCTVGKGHMNENHDLTKVGGIWEKIFRCFFQIIMKQQKNISSLISSLSSSFLKTQQLSFVTNESANITINFFRYPPNTHFQNCLIFFVYFCTLESLRHITAIRKCVSFSKQIT